MQIQQFITDFLIEGFSVIKDLNPLYNFTCTNLVNVESIDDIDYIAQYTNEQNEYLKYFSEYIETNYISKIFSNYTCLTKNMWDGVDSKSCEWHNDNKEGQDSCFLYYIDSSSLETGGALYFKNDQKEYKIYPASGTLVWMKQSPVFLHKADRSIKQRRVIHLEYKH